MRVKYAVILVLLAAAAEAQEFKPYPRANVTPAQWAAYYEEVRKKHGASMLDVEAQNLLVFHDAQSATSYAFTKPGHPAHPAWISRQIRESGGSIGVAQVGYFAGNEESFANLFRAYQQLNHRMREEALAKGTPSIAPAGSHPGTAVHVAGPSSKEQSRPASPPHSVASSNADVAWRPSQIQQRAAEATTRSYLAMRDADKVEEAYALLAPGLKQHRPLAAFRREVEEFNAKAGSVRTRLIRAVTWYKDTPQSGPGLFVAVDYASNFTNLALHCGYLVWEEQADGSLLQVREEVNFIDNETMAKLEPADLERVRNQFRC
jgi:hypothetical protein